MADQQQTMERPTFKGVQLSPEREAELAATTKRIEALGARLAGASIGKDVGPLLLGEGIKGQSLRAEAAPIEGERPPAHARTNTFRGDSRQPLSGQAPNSGGLPGIGTVNLPTAGTGVGGAPTRGGQPTGSTTGKPQIPGAPTGVAGGADISGLSQEEIREILSQTGFSGMAGFNQGARFDGQNLGGGGPAGIRDALTQFGTTQGAGTGVDAAGQAELPADSVIAALASQVAAPGLPSGTEFTTVQQAIQAGEFEQAITLDPVRGIRAARVTNADGIEVPLMQALRLGSDIPEAQAMLGSVPPEAIIQAAQAQNIPDIEIAGILRRAGIDPAVIDALPAVQAARGTLSNAAQVTAATGTESPEFQAAIAAEQDRLINFPVDPRATVQEQYTQLMADVESGTTPPWAAAAVRAAEGKLAARGLGSSSIAAEGITSALMQAALPIATQDAQVFQTMNLEKFSQTAALGMMRASHIATLDQQSLQNQQQANITNAQSALQIDLTNLNNEQQAAVVNANNALARATSNTGFAQQAAIEEARQNLQIDTSNLDATTQAAIQNASNMLTIETTNLGARQQALVENAKSFLNIEMTNLNNAQQTAIVNSQTRMQGLLSDQSAVNVARQLNTQNTLETARFMTDLGQRAKEFNAAQATDVSKFNQTIKDSRDKFNAENAQAIEQSNIDYLRRINTANTALENQANLVNSQNLLNISNTSLANLVTVARDREAFNFQASENAEERATRRAIAELSSNTNLKLQSNSQSADNAGFLGGLASDILGSIFDF